MSTRMPPVRYQQAVPTGQGQTKTALGSAPQYQDYRMWDAPTSQTAPRPGSNPDHGIGSGGVNNGPNMQSPWPNTATTPWSQQSTWGNNDQYSTQPVAPSQPQQAQVNQPTQFSPPSWMNWGNADWARSNGASQSLANLAQYIPWLQQQQNAYQYGMDFNEAQRRWNEQFGQQQQNDQFSQQLARDQESRAAWAAQKAAEQWQQQYAFDQEMGRGRLGLDQELGRGNLGVAQGQLGVAQGQLDLNRLTQQQLDAYRYAELKNRNEVAAMQAFGRAQQPNARWIRSW